MSNSTYIKGFKYRIYPNDCQKEIINKFVDMYRFVYNWGLALEEETYQKFLNGESEKRFLYFFDLCAEFKKFKSIEENSWVCELPNTTARLALRDVIYSFQKFFKKINRYPKFKSKKRSVKTFKTRSDRFSFNDDGKLRFEGLPKAFVDAASDRVDLHFDCGFRDEKFIQPSISIDNLGRYWVSFSVETECEVLDTPKTEPIGIDLGVKTTITLSIGEKFNKPKEKLEKIQRQIKKANRRVSRDINRRFAESRRTKTKYEDIPKSNRAIKRQEKLSKLCKRRYNIKRNFYHETAKKIVLRNPEGIVMETIPVLETMRKYKKTAKFLADADFYLITQIFKEKCTKYSVPFMQADRSFPSSQICSNCGSTRKIGGYHTYICHKCGMRMDRDINAAINLRNLFFA